MTTQYGKPAYIVTALRTPTVKAKGVFQHTRPDDLLSFVLKQLLLENPSLDPAAIDDVVVGCAMPEAEQGLNVARIALLLAGYPQSVAGVTVNRFCASGLQAVSQAADRIRLGEADVMVAAGVESMTAIPMVGHTPAFNPRLFDDDQIGIAYGMGVTAEQVAQRYQVSRDAQDAFALESHQRAATAQDNGWFNDEIRPYSVTVKQFDEQTQAAIESSQTIEQDNGIRRDSSIEALGKLRSVFDAKGTVTAGNSSQVSDGAAAVLLCSEEALKRFKLQPTARFAGFAVSGVDPEIMGIGPVEAIPKLVKQTGVSLNDIGHIELNEAFAAQSLAVINELDLNPDIVNPMGGAIALGHPLGATGAIRTATLVHHLQRQQNQYGMVTMCIGTGMGAAGLFERV